MQYELPLLCVLNGAKPVPSEVVESWQSLHDAINWSFAKRGDEVVKTVDWMARHLGMKRQHVSRMLNKRDLKLDSIQGHIWDCLTSWKAYEQFTELEKRRIAERATEQLTKAIQARMAA